MLQKRPRLGAETIEFGPQVRVILFISVNGCTPSRWKLGVEAIFWKFVARARRLKTTAEGAETDEQSDAFVAQKLKEH